MLGTVIEFTRRWETEPVQAVVVKHHHYAWCLGANSITVFCLDDSPRNLCSMDQFCANYRVLDKPKDEQEAAERVEAARVAYQEHLAQYPIWAERFANGQKAQF